LITIKGQIDELLLRKRKYTDEERDLEREHINFLT
jgi:hypothetical protein